MSYCHGKSCTGFALLYRLPFPQTAEKRTICLFFQELHFRSVESSEEQHFSAVSPGEREQDRTFGSAMRLTSPVLHKSTQLKAGVSFLCTEQF